MPEPVGPAQAPTRRSDQDRRGAEAVATRFARAMLAKDPEAASACFSQGASILTPDGTVVSGPAQIDQVLTQITSSIHQLEIRLGRTVVAEKIALSNQFWGRSSITKGGGTYRAQSTARLVLRKAEHWEIVLASPWSEP